MAVFNPGEEILSIKTGEAGRYQGLKRQLGVNPLAKIFEGNFLDGGTIEANLLAELDYKMPTINVAASELAHACWSSRFDCSEYARCWFSFYWILIDMFLYSKIMFI